jgi:alkanesulfonate monooxygenase SsuD/methylene tetrahydromethanopterin reductase-like flavin-dependent oxidoreductase (luciferase family)
MHHETPDLSQQPAPPELIAKAKAAVRECEVRCFWFWHPDAVLRTMEDIKEVIRELRRNGNRRAWRATQELQRCL